MFLSIYTNILQNVCKITSFYTVNTALYGTFSCTYAESPQAVCNSIPDDEHKMFETCRRKEELN